MTIFVRLSKRSFEINGFYLMVLTFCIFFGVGRILKSVLTHLKFWKKNAQQTKITNLKGGAFEVQAFNEKELGEIILSCISDNEAYLIKDPKLIKLMFILVKAKIQNESLALTPNLVRFLVLKLIHEHNNGTLVTKIGTAVFGTDNKLRTVTRL